jgi:hypothetical protein
MNDRKAALLLALSLSVGWPGPLPLQAACGCERMEVKNKGTARICSSQDLDDFVESKECERFPKGSHGCDNDKYMFECRLGVDTEHIKETEPFQRTGFQTIARLTDGSNPKDCNTGEILQMVIINPVAGSFGPNPNINPTSLCGANIFGDESKKTAIYVDSNPSNKFPKLGEMTPNGKFLLYGGDDYNYNEQDDILIDYDDESRLLTWWDNTDQSKDCQNEGAEWGYRYISFVKGTTGQTSCECAFDVGVKWPENAEPQTGFVVDTVRSVRCGSLEQ